MKTKETADKLETIRRLYYGARPSTISGDLARAIEILKSMATEEERVRAAVFMDGLSQMRSQWRGGGAGKAGAAAARSG
jgi:hypothetical protein